MDNGAPAPAHLSYATRDMQSRVLFIREAERAWVVIHRPGRRANAAAKCVAELFGETFVYIMVGGAFTAWAAPGWLLALIPGAGSLYAVTFALAWLCMARLDRPIVIELTPTELSIANLDEGARARRLSRDGLYAIYTVSHSPLIWIRRHGKEMEGFLVTPDQAESGRIAEFLREAAGLADSTQSAVAEMKK
jgi:hypothetical protein